MVRDAYFVWTLKPLLLEHCTVCWSNTKLLLYQESYRNLCHATPLRLCRRLDMLFRVNFINNYSMIVIPGNSSSRK